MKKVTHSQKNAVIGGAILLFYLSWGIPQIMAKLNPTSEIPNILFSIIYTGIAGCLIPIIIKNKFYLTSRLTERKTWLGLFLLIGTVLFATVGSDAIFQLKQFEYSMLTIFKYILLFFPMALAISLFSFLLIPNFVKPIKSKGLRNVLLISFIGLFFFLGFLVDTVFGDIQLALIMGLLGILFGISFIFLQSFWMMFLGFFITLLINTMAENKYEDYSLWIVLFSSILSLMIITIDLIKKRKTKQPFSS